MATQETKVIRDPVHGDIEVTEEEVAILNHPLLQRQRGIAQLGLCSLVYPGATHTRFLHALGTLHVAAQMVDALASAGHAEAKREARLIRIAALLHDVTHIPYGHMLEDAARLLQRHDRPLRTRVFLSEMADVIPRDVAADVERVLLTLGSEGEYDPRDQSLLPPKRYFIADIIGLGICADLLDYIARDTYYTGLRRSFDPRILRNLALMDEEMRGGVVRKRLGVAIIRKHKLRVDVITEIINILRTRYTLTERVYFHPVKVAAGAMLAKAVYCAGLGLDELAERADSPLYSAGDVELRQMVLESARVGTPVGGERGKAAGMALSLMEHLGARRVFKPIYRVTRAEALASAGSLAAALSPFDSAKQRLAWESETEEEAGLSPAGGLLIVNAPDPDMQLKEAAVMVTWRDGSVRPLNGITREEYPALADEIGALEDQYRALWSLNVFLNPTAMDVAGDLEAMVGERLGLSNDPLLAATVRGRGPRRRRSRRRRAGSAGQLALPVKDE